MENDDKEVKDDIFRKMRRINQQVSKEKIKEILKTQKRGVLSVLGDNGYPYGIPVNFIYDENDNAIYIHGAKEGHKIDAIRKSNKVSFTTWDNGYHKENDWAWTITSVILMGKAFFIEDKDTVINKIRALAMKYYPSKNEVDKEMSGGLGNVLLIKIDIEHMTGKEVHEK